MELQAYHADRTPVEQDSYLCLARESVPLLLNDIMNYRFQKRSKRLSAQSSDSGMEDDCPGCLSMYCHPCMEAQNDALRDVEELMKRLEFAESLFPSSKAFSELYPLYNSPEFVGRVKAMCLWYNMTKHQRLKLVILGRLLSLLENQYYQWPLPVSDLSDRSSVDSVSPTDSNSSSSSASDYLLNKNYVDYYNLSPIAILVDRKASDIASPYRKYIENILKTKGLSKSLNFLEKLHHHVLHKAKLTLTKPDNEEFFLKVGYFRICFYLYPFPRIYARLHTFIFSITILSVCAFLKTSSRSLINAALSVHPYLNSLVVQKALVSSPFTLILHLVLFLSYISPIR